MSEVVAFEIVTGGWVQTVVEIPSVKQALPVQYPLAVTTVRRSYLMSLFSVSSLQFQSYTRRTEVRKVSHS